MATKTLIPSICIIGRPNVGKSSLFNRLVGARRAVVVEESGTTRDRLETVTKIGKFSFRLVDTGGHRTDAKDDITVQVREQAYKALEESSLIIMVTDVSTGIVGEDWEVTKILRKADKPVLLVVNKADNYKLEQEAVDFFRLGLGEPIPISCLHNIGLTELKTRIIDSVKDLYEHTAEEKKYLKIAVVGRPNVGKSSFVNCLLKEKRVIVSEMPGTTRDSIDTFFTYDNSDYILIDTAGIRHRRKIKTAVDTYSVMRSEESIERCDVAVLLLDALDGITKDDLGILDFIVEKGRGCVILVNKWDLSKDIKDVTAEKYKHHLIKASERLRFYPIIFISAKTGSNVLDVISAVRTVDLSLDQKVPTYQLNKIFDKKDPSLVPIPRSKKRPNILYITQTGTRPVEFTVFVNDTALVLPAHMSFIENLLRKNIPLDGVPVRIRLRSTRKDGEEIKRRRGR